MVTALWFTMMEITFSPILYLNHVLFSPDFKLNLISILKLCHNLKCPATISVDHCVMQELNMMRMIGLGRKDNGLYMLKINDIHLEAQASNHIYNYLLKIPTQANNCHATRSFPLTISKIL